MKNLIWTLALLVLATGCSQEEPAALSEEPVAAAEEETAASAGDTQSETEAGDESAADDAVEVVEESAGADAAPADEAIVLAQADTSAPAQSWKYREGANFTRLVPTQPTVGGPDKIEVVEVFMYSCPACRNLEAPLARWEENKDANVRFERIPASFNNLAQIHAQLYYTEDVLVKNGKLKDRNAFRQMVFNEFHVRQNRLTSVTAIQRVFARAGVDEETFDQTWNSFEVNQKMRRGADLERRYGVLSVPTIIVNGKYRTDASMAGGYAQLLELIDELTVREGLR